MSRYIEQCKKCLHYQVCAEVMKNQLMIREKMLHEENAKCEHFFPTADVVEVVRCKDCKHKVDYRGRVMCGRRAGRIGLEWYGLSATSNDNYCSYGERRDTERCENNG